MNSQTPIEPKSKLANEIPAAPAPIPVAPSKPSSLTGVETMRQKQKDEYKKTLENSKVGTPKVTEIAKSPRKLKLDPKKALILVATPIALLFLCIILSIYTNFDTLFFDLSLEGRVVNASNDEPIEGAEIFLNDESKITTDEDGAYKISGLDQGKYIVKVQASGFRGQELEIGLGNAIFIYTTTKNFELEPATTSVLTGSFVGGGNHDFTEDILEINGKIYPINKNGTFTAPDVTEGNSSLVYKSVSFKDIRQTININNGNLNLDPINVSAAGDITGELIEYITETVVDNVQVTAENVNPSQISSDEGVLSIIDLDINKSYKLRVQAPGFVTREYDIEVKQGENVLFDLKMVEEKVAAYLKFREEGRDYNIYTSELDGKNEKQITNDPKLEPYELYYNSDENKLYFQTEKDGTSSTLREDIGLIYSIDLASPSTLNKVTTSATNLGQIIPNFKAQKAVNLTKSTNDNKSRLLQVMNLDGSNRTDLRSLTNGTIDNIFLSDNGSVVYFVERDAASNKYGLYYVKVSDKSVKLITDLEEITVFDTSADGTKVLFTAKNKTTTFKDLLLFNISTNELKTLKANFTGFQYQFIDESNDTVVFFDKKSDKDNIFTLNTSTTEEKQLSDLRDIDKITNIYQQDGHLYYITQRGLNILDFTIPKSNKIVVEGVFNAI